MKNKLFSTSSFLLVIVFAGCVFVSCNKADFNYPAGKVGISSIVYFPEISLVGSQIVTVAQGGTYTDSGAIATLNGDSASYTVSPTVDVSTPGIYTQIYSTLNPQGFAATTWRMVVVIPSSVESDPTIMANDFSGVYLRPATGVTSTWVKVGTGVYWVENPGGSSGVGKHVVVENFSGTSITIPTQDAPDFGGTVSSGDETYTVGVGFSWVFYANGYGTSLRTFVKQ